MAYNRSHRRWVPKGHQTKSESKHVGVIQCISEYIDPYMKINKDLNDLSTEHTTEHNWEEIMGLEIWKKRNETSSRMKP